MNSHDSTPIKLVGRGGPGRGQGRKPGTPNRVNKELKTLAQSYTKEAIHRLATLAGLVSVPEKDKDGMIQYVPGWTEDGKPMLNEQGTRIMVPKMRKVPGAGSESAQVAAIQTLLAYGHGKPTQPISGDEDAPPINITGFEIEEVLPGAALILEDVDYVELDESEQEARALQAIEDGTFKSA